MNSARSATLHRVLESSSNTSTIFLFLCLLTASFTSCSTCTAHLSCSARKPVGEVSSGTLNNPWNSRGYRSKIKTRFIHTTLCLARRISTRAPGLELNVTAKGDRVDRLVALAFKQFWSCLNKFAFIISIYLWPCSYKMWVSSRFDSKNVKMWIIRICGSPNKSTNHIT